MEQIVANQGSQERLVYEPRYYVFWHLFCVLTIYYSRRKNKTTKTFYSLVQWRAFWPWKKYFKAISCLTLIKKKLFELFGWRTFYNQKADLWKSLQGNFFKDFFFWISTTKITIYDHNSVHEITLNVTCNKNLTNIF